MSNTLLKRVLKDLSSCPESELKPLIESALRENDILHTLLEESNDGHIVLSSSLSLVLYNERAFTIVPVKEMSEEIKKGKTTIHYGKDDEMYRYISSVLDGKTNGEKKDFSFQVGNEIKTVRVDFHRFALEGEAFVDIILRDISEDIHRDVRLRRSESLASMTTMAAGVAHEIKNPLAAMSIHTQLLRKAFGKKGSLTLEDAEEYIRVIEEETETLNKIAVDFLFAVKPMDAELRLSSLNDISSEVVSFLLPEAEDKNIAVEEQESEFLPLLMLDERLVKQALLNLIQNAFSAMEDGGGKLIVKTMQDGDYVLLRVSDTGKGIEKDKLDKIFEPYYTTRAKGTGLGLTLVYKIMKEHGGDVHVNSTPSVGTTFELSFPIPKSERKSLSSSKEDKV